MDYAISTHSSISTQFSLQSSVPAINIMSDGSTIPFTGTFTSTNSTIMPYQFSNEHNLTHPMKLLNRTVDAYTCPSNVMPAGNLMAMILYAIVCIIGLFGNTLVIYVVLRFQKMKTVTNMYLLNLAIADECFLIGIPFLVATMSEGQWNFGKTMCKAYMVSTSITQFTSSIFLIIMSADRYIAVCHPISSPKYRSPFVSRCVTCAAWTASALIMLPVLLYANTIERGEMNNNKTSCIIEWPKEHVAGSNTTFILYSFFLGFAIPLNLIFCFYYLVLRKLQTVGPKAKSKEKKRSHRKVTKLVLTVITVYVLCWLPHWISQVALVNSSPDTCYTRLEITIFLLVGCLGYSNSAMNPILFFPRFGKRNSEKYCSTTKTAGHTNNKEIGNESAIAVDGASASVAIKTPPTPAIVVDRYDNPIVERPPVLHTDL
ncbi:hypothetical protein HA402_004956 [Bradysia odoriphaga]|nr:hypothetical protein HA402_004956 [Bradysia odoriphaga]